MRSAVREWLRNQLVVLGTQKCSYSTPSASQIREKGICSSGMAPAITWGSVRTTQASRALVSLPLSWIYSIT